MTENEKRIYLTADKVYPVNCLMRMSRGKFFPGAVNFETEQNQKLKNGEGFENPCYSCTWQLDKNCTTPEVKYGDKNNIWKIPPKNLDVVLT